MTDEFELLMVSAISEIARAINDLAFQGKVSTSQLDAIAGALEELNEYMAFPEIDPNHTAKILKFPVPTGKGGAA